MKPLMQGSIKKLSWKGYDLVLEYKFKESCAKRKVRPVREKQGRYAAVLRYGHMVDLGMFEGQKKR